MSNTIKITRVTVLTGTGTDKIVCYTELPSGILADNEPAICEFSVARGSGRDWAIANIGLEPEVISIARDLRR